MTKVSYNVTSVGEAPGAERGQRMKKYVVTMSIRMACILAMPFVDGWWILVCALGAVFLPYVAVIIANVRSGASEGESVEHATLELAGPPTADFDACCCVVPAGWRQRRQRRRQRHPAEV